MWTLKNHSCSRENLKTKIYLVPRQYTEILGRGMESLLNSPIFPKKVSGGTTTTTIGSFEDGKFKAQTLITIDSKLRGAAFDAAIGEEGSHAADGKAVIDSGLLEIDGKIYANQNITPYDSEQTGFRVTSRILANGNTTLPYACGAGTCDLGKGVPIDPNFPGLVDRIIGSNERYNQGGMPMSRENPGASVVIGVVGQAPKTTVPR